MRGSHQIFPESHHFVVVQPGLCSDCFMVNIKTLTKRQSVILELLFNYKEMNTNSLLEKLNKSQSSSFSQITLTRELKPLVDEHYVDRIGKGRAVRYCLSVKGGMQAPVNIDLYFSTQPDKRIVNEFFNFEIFKQLMDQPVFSKSEIEVLKKLDVKFRKQKSGLTPTIKKKEFERLTIELSWKSAAIEGNTYSLLETETLFKEGVAAKGKKKEEARMLLNHKSALNFIHEHKADYFPLTLSYIEKTHSVLTENLNVEKNLRKSLVGITGTRYKPLDNEFQIKEAMMNSCNLINAQNDSFSRALLSILLISYIQPFEDGNKRTSRIIANALLMNQESFPLSFRSVDETEYKKAILLFYERNNLSAFKNIFIEQAEFSVKNYFVS